MTMHKRLSQLLKAMGGARHLLILPHNDPDPDAIASAVGLAHLVAETQGVESHIAYKGIVGRAENKALVRHLGHPLRRLAAADLARQWPTALVDTQPGAGNNPLPPGAPAAIVLDHHPWREATSTATFADVRPGTGATSTLVTEYLQEAGLEPGARLATALFYGIKSDTLGLIRGTGPADMAAYFYLQPRVDTEALLRIERAQVPAEYFRQLDATLHSARIYDDVVISYVGPMRRPDLAAEMADLLLRLKGVCWAICMGLYQGRLVLAIRTRTQRDGAGRIVQAMVGDRGTAGGHGTMAGGQIPLQGQEPEVLVQHLAQRALELLKVPESAGRLLMT
jgi:nanoRNase/pAp phosphatase (c-di-AMP/oligoRNAs hydrolase)